MKLIRADWLMIAAFVLMLATHSVTTFLVSTHTSSEEVAITAKQLTTLVEQNPIAAFALQFKKAQIVYSLVLSPALMWGLYYYMRKKYKDRDIVVVEMFAFTSVIMFLINFLNDATYLLAWAVKFY